MTAEQEIRRAFADLTALERRAAVVRTLVSAERPHPGDKRPCPECGRPQHYTGAEHGWAHDAGWYHDSPTDTWHCADPRANTIVHDCGNAAQCWCGA